MEYQKINMEQWLLNTPLEYLFTFTKLDKRWKGILKNPRNSHFKKCTSVGDLLMLHTRSYNSACGVGITSWKKLMKAFFEFGIKNCFDYPIAQDPQRYRLTDKYIERCKKEITGK